MNIMPMIFDRFPARGPGWNESGRQVDLREGDEAQMNGREGDFLTSKPPRILIVVLLGIFAVAGCGSAENAETGTLVIRVGGFTFPSLASVLPALISHAGLDRRHGLKMEVRQYGSVSAYYAGLAVAEVDSLPGGPIVVQRMRRQGVPIRMVSTYASLASLLVIASDPLLKRLEDLKGKTLAADMSSSEFHILRLIGAARGVDLASEVKVLQAVPSVARAHLQSGEADAILTFEPAATLALKENPEYRVILKGDEAWREFSGHKGWLLVTLLRDAWIDTNPQGVAKWLAAMRDAVQMIEQDPQEADRIVAQSLGLPPGVFSQALQQGRIHFKIEPVSQQKDALTRMFQTAVESGYVEELPDSKIFYEPQ